MSSPRLSIIPAGAVTDPSLEARDLQVLCLLGRHTDRAGWCARSQVRMAGELRCGRASVQRSLERLYEAGWVEKKRRDEAGKADESSRPSASYAYRVVLDRDDFAFENATRDAEGETDESYAETASEQGGCPPVGTPNEPGSDVAADTENGGEGAHIDGHPGAHPERAPGAHTYVGTKNAPLERPHLERERDARARDLKDRKARFLVTFEARWPTAAVDDRQRTAYASDALTEAEEADALAGIAPFLENLKKLYRKGVPAGWNYLEQKRWTLLEQAKPDNAGPLSHASGSAEAKAVKVLHDIAGRAEAFAKIWRRSDGSVNFNKPMSAQLTALSQAPEPSAWVELSRNQAGAWEGLLRSFFDPGVMRQHMREGARAPWLWPPRKDGTLSDVAPPGTLSDDDIEAFADEGQNR
ncbi:hypothetical protein [Bradyrhizobium sp.]|uniref:hypothetical protein n=1 Tax=Bradyrhizobium sp. TaxID=376 RepID=UPI00273137D7|nr:hypothetical protein [Bradyrhizobium sp.]